MTHPLTSKPGETVRFYVVAAGPTLDTDFHIVGTIFDRAWVNGDMTQFQQGVQTVGVPAGGGAVFDVKIDEPGSTHSSVTPSPTSTSARSGSSRWATRRERRPIEARTTVRPYRSVVSALRGSA